MVLLTRPASQNEALKTMPNSSFRAAFRSHTGYFGFSAIGFHHASTAARESSCRVSSRLAMVKACLKGYEFGT